MAKEDLTQMLRDGELTPDEICPLFTRSVSSDKSGKSPFYGTSARTERSAITI